MPLLLKPLPNLSQSLPNPSQFKCWREPSPPGPCQDLELQIPRNQERWQIPGTECGWKTPGACGMWGSLLSHHPRSCRKMPLDPAHTQPVPQGSGKIPGSGNGRRRGSSPAWNRCCPGRSREIPTIPTPSWGWVEPGCSLTPFQGRAVFIFGNIKAEEEVIKLKKPRLLPREPGAGKRCRPRAFLAQGHGPAAATAHPGTRMEQEVLP